MNHITCKFVKRKIEKTIAMATNKNIDKHISSKIPELDSKSLRVLCYMAYIGEPLTDNEYRKYFKYSEKELSQIFSTLRNYKYIDNTYIVASWHIRIVLYMLENHPEWEQDFKGYNWRTHIAVYLWNLARMIYEGDIDGAIALAKPYIGIGHDKINVYQYICDILTEDSRYYKLVDSDKLESNIATTLYSQFLSNALNNKVIDNIRKTLPVDTTNHQSIMDMLALYEYFVSGTPIETPNRETYWSLAAKGIKELYRGGYDEALAAFKNALLMSESSKGNLFSTKRTTFASCPLLNYFYGIALIRQKTTGRNVAKELDAFRNSSDIKLRPDSFLIKLITDYYESAGSLIKNTVRQRVEMILEDNNTPVYRSMAYIALKYFGSEVDELSYGLAAMPQSAIISQEMSPFLPLTEEKKKKLADTFGGQPLLLTIKRKEEWENILNDITYKLSQSKNHVIKSEQEEEKKELNYFMSGEELVEISIVDVMEDGRKGKKTYLSRTAFMEMRNKYMNATDINVAVALKNKGADESDMDIIIPLLKDSGRLFADVSSAVPMYIPIEVETRNPNIEFTYKGTQISVTTNIGYSNQNHGHKKHTVIYEYDALYSIVTTNALQRDILDKFCNQQTFPVSAAAALKKMTENLKGIIDVTDNLEVELESVVQSEGKIAVRIKPEDSNYKVTLLAAPSCDGKIRCVPGQGSETIYDELDGKIQAIERDFIREYENHTTLNTYIEKEDIAETDSYNEYTIYTLSGLYKLMSFIQDNQEQYFIEWPEGHILRFRGTIKSSDISISVKSEEKWFEVEGDIAINGKKMSLQELLKQYRLSDDGEFIKISNEEYVKMSDTIRKRLAMLDALPSTSSSAIKVPKIQISALAKTIENIRQKTDEGYEQLQKRLEAAYRINPEVPKDLRATLRDYQREGYIWMKRLDAWGAGACLADDMGLGKTLQALAFLLSKAEEGASLVVAPKSVVPNWVTEAARFAPNLNVTVLNESGNRRKVINEAKANDLIICTYGVLTTESAALASKEWNVVCLDEAQQIKNKSAIATQAALRLKAASRLALTGTPLQNNVSEMWPLFQFINPGLLGTWTKFRAQFVKTDLIEEVKYLLKDMTQPFILRRTKESVLDELPDKTINTYSIELTNEEQQVYEEMRRLAEVKFKKEKSRAEQREASGLKMNFFDELTKLRLASCSMQLVDSAWSLPSSKVAALIEIVSELTIIPTNNIIIFSQFTSFLAIIRKELEKNKMQYLYLDGSTPTDKRRKMVEEFQEGKCNIFMLSMKAGGLGINLTAANHVIILDPWWNPAIENQAMDRAYRIGQKRCVSVIRLISKNTIEEKIIRMHEKKQHLSDDILEGTEETHKLTYDDIIDMVTPF